MERLCITLSFVSRSLFTSVFDVMTINYAIEEEGVHASCESTHGQYTVTIYTSPFIEALLPIGHLVYTNYFTVGFVCKFT